MTLFWAADARPMGAVELAGLLHPTPAVGGEPWERAAPLIQFHRQDVLERRAGQAALRERSRADHQKAAATLADEIGRHGQLRACEEITLDVGDETARGNERRMRVQGPVPTNFPFESEGFGVRRQQQLDSRGIEPDSVIQRQDLVTFVDTADHHHRHQDVDLVDVTWVSGE